MCWETGSHSSEGRELTVTSLLYPTPEPSKACVDCHPESLSPTVPPDVSRGHGQRACQAGPVSQGGDSDSTRAPARENSGYTPERQWRLEFGKEVGAAIKSLTTIVTPRTFRDKKADDKPNSLRSDVSSPVGHEWHRPDGILEPSNGIRRLFQSLSL